MNILYTFLNFNSLTGSELYYYELSRAMVKLGHKVTIASNCFGEIKDRAEADGVICRDFSSMTSGFSEFDIIHASHKPVLHGLSLHKISCPIVVTVHSEVLDIEKVEDSEKISHFIGIRPAIYDSLPKEKRSLIYNPIDFSRFNTSHCTEHNVIFIPGTINYLRAGMIADIAHTYGDKYNIVVMGENDYPDVKIEGVSYLETDFHVEDYIKNASMVAGIIKGRTYIESMLCGKRYLDYQVNEMGVISNVELILPSDYLAFRENTVHKSEFDSVNIARKIEFLYRSLL